MEDRRIVDFMERCLSGFADPGSDGRPVEYLPIRAKLEDRLRWAIANRESLAIEDRWDRVVFIRTLSSITFATSGDFALADRAVGSIYQVKDDLFVRASMYLNGITCEPQSANVMRYRASDWLNIRYHIAEEVEALHTVYRSTLYPITNEELESGLIQCRVKRPSRAWAGDRGCPMPTAAAP